MAIHRLAAAAGISLILLFFSEFYFVNAEPVAAMLALFSYDASAVASIAVLLAFYLLPGWVLITLLGLFPPRGWSALFLIAALIGWTIEGVMVPAVWEAIPISLIWTSLSWHTFIDVLAGWYITAIALRRWPVWGLALWLIIVGVVWSAWATWYWVEPEDILPPMDMTDFARLVLVTSTGWILGVMLSDRALARLAVQAPKPQRFGVIILVIICSVLTVSNALPFLPLLPFFVIPVLLTIGLLWSCRNQTGATMIESFSRLPSPGRYVLLPLVPISAIVGYWVILKTDWQIETELVVLTLLAAGALIYVVALTIVLVTAVRVKSTEVGP